MEKNGRKIFGERKDIFVEEKNNGEGKGGIYLERENITMAGQTTIRKDLDFFGYFFLGGWKNFGGWKYFLGKLFMGENFFGWKIFLANFFWWKFFGWKVFGWKFLGEIFLG